MKIQLSFLFKGLHFCCKSVRVFTLKSIPALNFTVSYLVLLIKRSDTYIWRSLGNELCDLITKTRRPTSWTSEYPLALSLTFRSSKSLTVIVPKNHQTYDGGNYRTLT